MPDKIALTDRDKYAAKQLAECTFLPGSYNKRFAHSLAYYAETDIPVTEKQLANLWRLVYRYRRQILRHTRDEALIKETEEKSKADGSNANLD